MITYTSDEATGFPSGRSATSGWTFMIICSVPADLADDLCGRGAAQHDHIIVAARVDQRFFETVGKHEDGRKDEHHQRDTSKREYRRKPPDPRAWPDQEIGIFIRSSVSSFATHRHRHLECAGVLIIGKTAAIMPDTMAVDTDSAMVIISMLNTGKKVGKRFANPRVIGNSSASPPGRRPSMRAALVLSRSIRRCGMRKNTAISKPRIPVFAHAPTSRSYWRARVRIMPMMTNEITFIEVIMALDMETKLCWNSFSVSVLVAASDS